jgi:hypothetical protein
MPVALFDAGRGAGDIGEGFERRQPGGAIKPRRGQQVVYDPQRLVTLRLGTQRDVTQPSGSFIVERAKGIARQHQSEAHCGYLDLRSLTIRRVRVAHALASTIAPGADACGNEEQVQ